MTRQQIDRFLATLAKELAAPARAFVTGASAATLWGRVRGSRDIDLGLEMRGKSPLPWTSVQAAIDRTSHRTGIPTNIAEDIDRWGMITLLDYKRSSRLYRKFGKLEVRLLNPVNWSIGKLTRFIDSDITDVAKVFGALAVPAAAAARTWGRALRASPASSAQFLFRRNVETFFKNEGKGIWGPTFDAAAALRAFERAARISAS